MYGCSHGRAAVLFFCAIPNSGWNPDIRTVTVITGNNDLSVTLLPIATTGPQGPQGIAFDGSSMWVTSGNSVVKLRSSDGVKLGEYLTGNSPVATAFDILSVWGRVRRGSPSMDLASG